MTTYINWNKKMTKGEVIELTQHKGETSFVDNEHNRSLMAEVVGDILKAY